MVVLACWAPFLNKASEVCMFMTRNFLKNANTLHKDYIIGVL